MFLSEHILFNTTISVLERAAKGEIWAARDVIFTDRALYFFAQVQQSHAVQLASINGKAGVEGARGTDYLHDTCERMDMRHFMAAKPGASDTDDEQELNYERILPR